MSTQGCDSIIIGACHNGLASSKVLADKGLKVTVLVKNTYVGRTTGKREDFNGCRNEVEREQLKLTYSGSAVDLIDKLYPIKKSTTALEAYCRLRLFSLPIQAIARLAGLCVWRTPLPKVALAV